MICSNLNKNSLFVLYEGSAVTVYNSKSNESHSSTENKDDSEIKTALLFAKYIAQVEKLEDNSISYLS